MDRWPDTHESLIQRVKDPADGAAWEAFLAIYRPVVYRLARSRGLQHADAEDLAQKVFLSVSAAIDRWEPEDSKPPFRMWLGRIARNAIVNAITRRPPDAAAGSTSAQDALNALASDEEATQEVVRESQLQAIRWAADQIRAEFSPATWQMFFKTSIAQRPVNEVAEELNKSAGAVYMARYRVMQRLKEKVGEVTQLWSEVT